MNKIVIRDIAEIDSSNFEEIILKLPLYRQEKIKKLNEKNSKLQSILAGLILHDEFGDLDKEIIIDEFGKERLMNHYFSVSHSGTKVMVVFSDKDVGCDIEKNKEVSLDIAKRFFLKEEYEEILRSENPQKMFVKYWTIKESALKCMGRGLRDSLSSVKIKDSKLLNDDVVLTESNEIDGYQYSICNKKR